MVTFSRGELCIEVVNTEVVHWRALNEIDSGVCDGMTYHEIEQRLPNEYIARKVSGAFCQTLPLLNRPHGFVCFARRHRRTSYDIDIRREKAILTSSSDLNPLYSS